MIRWIKQKLFFRTIKKEVFRIFEHGDEWVTFLTNLAIAYKDSTPDNIRKEFVDALATKIHEDSSKNNKSGV